MSKTYIYLLMTIAAYLIIVKGVDALSVATSQADAPDTYIKSETRRQRITTAPATNETIAANKAANQKEDTDALKEQIKKDISFRYNHL